MTSDERTDVWAVLANHCRKAGRVAQHPEIGEFEARADSASVAHGPSPTPIAHCQWRR